MTITVDRNIYSDECITKCIYSLLGTFECQRHLQGNEEHIDIRCLKPISEKDIQRIFLQALNDYKAREVIARETKDIRTILYAKAFADCDDFNEEAE